MIRRLFAIGLLLLMAFAPATTPERNARVFDRVWSLVERRYWDRDRIARDWPDARERFRPRALAAPDSRGLYLVMGEMLDMLGDSHVYVVDPVRRGIERGTRRGDPVGFGFETEAGRDGTQTVAAVDRESPAGRAGVQIGWRLARVDGAAPDVDFAAEADRPTRLEFVDEHGAPHRVTLTAGPALPHATRQAEMLPGDLALLRLDAFDAGAAGWLRDALGARPAAVILDLRGNDGGEAGAVARVAGQFFPADRPMLVEIGTREVTRSTQGAGRAAYLGPLAVLIGPNSASGAEVIAALVRDARRGVLLGDRSAGALTSAAEYPLPDGGLLSLAESDVRAASGERIEGVGVAPDYRIVATLDERRRGQDPAVECARRLLLRLPAPARCGFPAAAAASMRAAVGGDQQR